MVSSALQFSVAQAGVAQALGWAIATDPAYGADSSGTLDSVTAINSAIAAKSTVWLPPGTYKVDGTQIQPLAGTRLLGSGQHATKLKAGSSLTTAVILGVSGNAAANVEIRDIEVDGNYSGGVHLAACVQMSNAPEFIAERVYFHNCYGGGVILQGVGATSGCPRSLISACRFDSLGMADGSTGHGINIAGGSDHSRIVGNEMTNIVGGMGVAGVTSSSGSPTHLAITANIITMAASTTGFEGIGLDSGCTHAAIVANTITNSQDNGISASAAYATVTGNTIDGTLNHGIAATSYSAITGNTIRNCGRATLSDGQTYAAVALSASTGATVIGNTMIDDQGTPTMAYLVKSVGTSGGGNKIGPNAGAGWTQATPYTTSWQTSDVFLDTNTNPTGITLSRIYGPAGAPMLLQTSTNALSQFFVGNTVANVSPTGQLAVATNSTSRPSLMVAAVTSQTADLITTQDVGGNPLLRVVSGGALAHAKAAQTLNSNGAVTIDASKGNTHTVTLAANATSSSITNPSAGQRLTLAWLQDATGGRTYAWPGNCKFAGSGPSDTTASKQTSVDLEYDGTNWIERSRAVAVG